MKETTGWSDSRASGVCFLARRTPYPRFAHVRDGDSVPFGPINNIKQTFEHPQVNQRLIKPQNGTDRIASQAVAREVTVEVEVSWTNFDMVVIDCKPDTAPSSREHQVSRTRGIIQWKKDASTKATSLAVGAH